MATIQRRYDHYPEVICADQMYRTRANRAFCQRHGLRSNGPRLGHPRSDPELADEAKKQFSDDLRQRHAVEDRIGQGTRWYGLDLIRETLATSQGSAIGSNVLVIDPEKILPFLVVLMAYWPGLLLVNRAT
jgi:hypothetical protein